MAPLPERAPGDQTRERTLALELAGFAARAGHDLLGPLNQASSLVALFVHRHRSQPEGEEDSAEANRLLDFLETSAFRIQGAIAGVRPFLDVAACAPGVQPVDLNASLEAARLRLESAIAASGASIGHDALPVIAANGDQMAVLFEILIGNAIKFRRPSEAPRIEISSKRSGEAWVLAVADNGIGIDAEFRESVFLPFRRLHGSDYPGAGMGLATAKLIVGLHGGDIRIEPVSESGTAPGIAVVFTVPVLHSPADR